MLSDAPPVRSPTSIVVRSKNERTLPEIKKLSLTFLGRSGRLGRYHNITRLAHSSSDDGDSGCGCRRSRWKLYFKCCALARLAGDVDHTPVLADNVEGAKQPHGSLDARALRS